MYKVVFTKTFKKEISKLDKYTQKLILSWILNNIIEAEDPKLFGKALVGDLKGHWRYRVGDYRLIAKIVDEEVIIYFLNVGHRREIYR